MQLQLIILFTILNFSQVFANDEPMKELFRKYELVMDHKKIEFIDDVFTKKFISDSGGKKQLIKKIMELPSPLSPPGYLKWSWKKGVKGDLILARATEFLSQKNISKGEETEFIIIKENGSFKIEGTLSDGH